MCGILFILSDDEREEKNLVNAILSFLSHRGPDCHHNHSTVVKTQETNSATSLQFHGTVLHLRGQLTPQPLVSATGHVLLWNGEVFGGGVNVPEDANDTKVLFERLCSIPFHEAGHEHQMVSLFQTIHGPWAFIFYDAVNRNVWYGRDYFGRRSLMSRYENGTFVLSSVGHRELTDNFVEVPAKQLYCLNVCAFDASTPVKDSVRTFNMSLYTDSLKGMMGWHRCLQGTISDEAQNGTINDDKSVICCSCLVLNNSLSATSETQKNQLDRDGLCTSCCVSDDNTFSSTEVQDAFLKTLREAVNKRVYNLPRSHLDGEGGGSKVGILFSGGIDSVVITALADQCVPQHETIDLINVAFAQKHKVQQNVKKKHQRPPDEKTLNFDVPDRVTGRTALKELSTTRKWNFIEVDVTLDELQRMRKSDITNLVYPLDSVLDDSIGCAIWFAARGVGKCYTVGEGGVLKLVEENYKCPAKVILTGMGADEQLGGYARHRTKFEHFGWSGLGHEMAMELERISSRNLGRDDRCISDHGREARFPFLDENVVAFLNQIPVCVKCDPRLPRGQGEKILLREIATHLGLHYASNLPKRAIQFGSKIAKLEGRKEKGSDNCKRLENIILE